MRRVRVDVGLGLLATSLVAGCGTASTSENAWRYVGDDPTLGAPMDPAALRRRMAAERTADGASASLPAKFEQDFAAWRAAVVAAMDASRAACVRETGDSGTRHWTGYDEAFLACMKARGWSRPVGTDPL